MYFQILLFAFLKVIEEGSHMVMMECPDTVNTLLHEFFLWEPDITRKDCVDDPPVTADTTTYENAGVQNSSEPANK